MKNFTFKRLKKPALRFALALLGAHLIVTHDAQETWLELFRHNFYYQSLIGSLAIAVVLIEYIHWISQKLNARDQHTSLTVKRLKWQFLLGFLVSVIIAVALAAFLFWINNADMIKAGYFNKLFILIVLFIFTINAVHILADYHARPVKNKFKYKDLEPSLPKNPAIIYYVRKSYLAVDFNGLVNIWPYTLKKTLTDFDDKVYFQINRYCIIHRAVISSVIPLKGQSVKIIPKVDCQISLITSRRKTSSFKAWTLAET